MNQAVFIAPISGEKDRYLENTRTTVHGPGKEDQEKSKCLKWQEWNQRKIEGTMRHITLTANNDWEIIAEEGVQNRCSYTDHFHLVHEAKQKRENILHKGIQCMDHENSIQLKNKERKLWNSLFKPIINYWKWQQYLWKTWNLEYIIKFSTA